MNKKQILTAALLAAFTVGANADATLGTPFNASGNHIPGTIEAEDYDLGGEGVGYARVGENEHSDATDYRTDATFIYGSDGNYWLAELDGGVWLNYTVDVAETGYYELTTYIAKGNLDGRQFSIQCDGEEVTRIEFNDGVDGNWGQFVPVVRRGLYLTEGQHLLHFDIGGGFNIDKFVFARQTDMSFADMELPGRIEVENFDLGGEGVAFHVSSTNGGVNYRPDIKILEWRNNNYTLGNLSGGDWFNYTVTINETGYYDMTFCTATMNQGGSFYLRNAQGDMLSRAAAIPVTGDWGDFREFTQRNVYLEAGRQIIQLYIVNGFNIDYLDFAYVGTTPAVELVAPGTIQAEDYDDEGLVYGQTEQIQNGFIYRPAQKVKLEWGNDSYVIAFTSYDDIYPYTFEAQEAGTYSLTAYLASGNDNASIAVSVDGGEAATLSVPNLGWGDYSAPALLEGIQLTEGTHVVKFFNVSSCNFDKFVLTRTGDLTTGIDASLNEKGERINEKFFDLTGRRVAQPQKGLYIQNGRKVILQ